MLTENLKPSSIIEEDATASFIWGKTNNETLPAVLCFQLSAPHGKK